MTIIKRNRLIRRHAETIAHRDGVESCHQHCRYMEARGAERSHGQHCCHHAYEDAARNTYHHLTTRRAYRSPTGRVHLAIGLPAIQRMLALAAYRAVGIGTGTGTVAATENDREQRER